MLAIGTLSLVVAGGIIIGLQLRPKTVVIVPTSSYHDTQPAVSVLPKPTIGTHDYAISLLPALSNDALDNLINTQRVHYGLNSLTLSPKLENAAMARCDDIVNQNYFSHKSPDGVSDTDVLFPLVAPGSVVGENLQASNGTPDSIVLLWMNSPGHRHNILDSRFTTEGFATCVTDHYAGSSEVDVITVEEFAQQLK